uniref:Secretory carrier-associated membrane protein n=1 Tax=Prolemur simus TaxID=1328070 RepID=A0A8C9A5A1_PROSS
MAETADPPRISEGRIYHILPLVCSTLALTNFLACTASSCVEPSNGLGFGLSLLWLLLFPPGSFLCRYCPMNKVFPSDCSLNVFVFAFLFFLQDVLFVLQAVAVPGWGSSGWISTPRVRRPRWLPVYVLRAALLFAGFAVLGLVMLKPIHSCTAAQVLAFKRPSKNLPGVICNPEVPTAAATATAGARRMGAAENSHFQNL